MKKYIVYFIVMLFQLSMLLGDDAQLFKQANEKFVTADFAGALHDYRMMQHKNSVVWQNMGNCYFNQQEYVRALVCWKRACHGVSWKHIVSLLNVEKNVYQRLHLQPPFTFYFSLKRVALMIPLILVQIIFILLLCWFLLVIIRCWRWQELVRSDRRLMYQLFFGCFFCGILWYGHGLFLEKNQAIVVKQNVLVYAGPERTFHIVGKLQPGMLVNPLQKKQGMCQIRQAQSIGWVAQDAVEFINNYE